MVLMGTLKERGGELIEAPSSRLHCHSLQTQGITILASLPGMMRGIFQKVFEEIFIPIDDFQSDLLRILLNRLKPSLVFLIRVDVGIEKIANNVLSPFS